MIKQTILSCNKAFQAAYLVMFQGALDQEMFVYWNDSGYDDLMTQLRGNPEVIKINLPGRKKSRNRDEYYSFIGVDAIKALKTWLEERPLNAESIITNQFGGRLTKRNLKAYWIRQLRRIGLVGPRKGKPVSHRTGKNLHEMRDVWRSQWSISPANHIVGEYMMCQNCNATPEITTLTSETTQTTLTNLYELAKKITDLKDSETQTDAGESVLLMGLLDLVDKETPNYYSVAAIKAASSRYNEVLPDWFNHRWIGRAMKRLGFTEKRRVGNGMQYKLDSNSVLDMANRLGIHLPEKDPDIEKDPETETELEDPDPDTILFDDYESEKLYCLIRDNPGQTRDAFINLAYKAGLSAQESGVSWRKIQKHLTHNEGLWRVK